VNEALQTRLGLLLGLLAAASAAAWWLGATRLSLAQSGGADGVAGSALLGLWLTRAVLLAPFALRAGALQGARVALVAAIALVLAAWPVVLAAAHASTLPAPRLLLAEALLLGGGALLAAVGAALRTLIRSTDDALAIATMLGIAIAAATWTWAGAWMRTLS
jgi:hypothetical protein